MQGGEIELMKTSKSSSKPALDSIYIRHITELKQVLMLDLLSGRITSKECKKHVRALDELERLYDHH